MYKVWNKLNLNTFYLYTNLDLTTSLKHQLYKILCLLLLFIRVFSFLPGKLKFWWTTSRLIKGHLKIDQYLYVTFRIRIYLFKSFTLYKINQDFENKRGGKITFFSSFSWSQSNNYFASFVFNGGVSLGFVFDTARVTFPNLSSCWCFHV